MGETSADTDFGPLDKLRSAPGTEKITQQAMHLMCTALAHLAHLDF